jgi:hypothetical protein
MSLTSLGLLRTEQALRGFAKIRAKKSRARAQRGGEAEAAAPSADAGNVQTVSGTPLLPPPPPPLAPPLAPRAYARVIEVGSLLQAAHGPPSASITAPQVGAAVASAIEPALAPTYYCWDPEYERDLFADLTPRNLALVNLFFLLVLLARLFTSSVAAIVLVGGLFYASRAFLERARQEKVRRQNEAEERRRREDEQSRRDKALREATERAVALFASVAPQVAALEHEATRTAANEALCGIRMEPSQPAREWEAAIQNCRRLQGKLREYDESGAVVGNDHAVLFRFEADLHRKVGVASKRGLLIDVEELHTCLQECLSRALQL